MLQEIPQKSVFFCLERPHYHPCHYSLSDKIHHHSAPLSQIPFISYCFWFIVNKLVVFLFHFD